MIAANTFPREQGCLDPYIILLAAFGVVVLLTVWLPLLVKNLPLSLPILCICIGIALFAFPFPLPRPIPLEHPEIAERVTEFVVIIALAGAGLRLDRHFGWRSWVLTWRLLGITMPLSILAFGLLGWLLLGLDIPEAILLGAVLAPTDPVLASDVQVGPPNSGEEDEVRFALTSEAGLNDGLAFPFVNLAIALAAASSLSPSNWTVQWIAEDVVWKLGVGALLGFVLGLFLGALTFRLPGAASLSSTGDGLVALGVTCLVYAVTEMAHGYGFLAVFVAAVCLRSTERDHEYHTELHQVAEQIERLLMMVLLVLLGGAIVHGLLKPLDVEALAFGLIALLLVRPLAGWIGLIGASQPRSERAVISFYGIRGLGSAYYLSYALGEDFFNRADYIWAVVGLVIVASILLHGMTVTPVMRLLDRVREA